MLWIQILPYNQGIKVTTYFVSLFFGSCQDIPAVLFKQEINTAFGLYFSTNAHTQMYAHIPEEHWVCCLCLHSAVT